MAPYNADGVDVTLIRWMLSLTPSERLDVLQSFVDEFEEIRRYRANDPVSGSPAGPAET